MKRTTVKQFRHFVLAALAATALTGIASAQTITSTEKRAGTSASAATMTEGEIRKIDKAAKKITLRHGPIQNLDMPAMTMVFQVPDATLLEGLAVGDKLRFHAEQKNGAFIVTRVEKAGS